MLACLSTTSLHLQHSLSDPQALSGELAQLSLSMAKTEGSLDLRQAGLLTVWLDRRPESLAMKYPVKGSPEQQNQPRYQIAIRYACCDSRKDAAAPEN